MGRLVVGESGRAPDPFIEPCFPLLFLCIPSQTSMLVGPSGILMERPHHLVDMGVLRGWAG